MGYKKSYFGNEDFAIVTGLKCQGSLCTDITKAYDGNLRKRYWMEDQKVYEHSVKDLICDGRQDFDEDSVKVFALYFIHFYPLSS